MNKPQHAYPCSTTYTLLTTGAKSKLPSVLFAPAPSCRSVEGAIISQHGVRVVCIIVSVRARVRALRWGREKLRYPNCHFSTMHKAIPRAPPERWALCGSMLHDKWSQLQRYSR